MKKKKFKELLLILSCLILCISLTQEVPETANKQLWEEKLGNVMLLHVWFRDQSMYTREPEVRKDQFCISWWLLISDGSHFMASQFHFVAIRMTSNACHSWWLTGSFTLTIMITFQLSLISEIIASEKGGADNTDNISVWSILQYPQEFYRSPIQW